MQRTEMMLRRLFSLLMVILTTFVVGCGGEMDKDVDEMSEMRAEGAQGEWRGLEVIDDGISAKLVYGPDQELSHEFENCIEYEWKPMSGPPPVPQVWTRPDSMLCEERAPSSQSNCEIFVEDGSTDLRWLRNSIPLPSGVPGMTWNVLRFGLERSNCGRMREVEFGFDPANPMAPNTVGQVEGNISCDTTNSACFIWPRGGRADWTHPEDGVYRWKVSHYFTNIRPDPADFATFTVD